MQKTFHHLAPPVSQQKQVVTILDKAFATIDTVKANAEQNLQNAKELFEPYQQKQKTRSYLHPKDS